jgi:hypothetical protein
VHAQCYEEVGNETGVSRDSSRLFPLLSYLQRVPFVHRAKPDRQEGRQGAGEYARNLRSGSLSEILPEADL